MRFCPKLGFIRPKGVHNGPLALLFISSLFLGIKFDNQDNWKIFYIFLFVCIETHICPAKFVPKRIHFISLLDSEFLQEGRKPIELISTEYRPFFNLVNLTNQAQRWLVCFNDPQQKSVKLKKWIWTPKQSELFMFCFLTNFARTCNRTHSTTVTSNW